MKRLINLIIRILVNAVVFSAILLLCIVIYFSVFASENNLSTEDTISYVKSIGNQISDYTLSDKNSVDLSLSDQSDSSGNMTINTSNTNRFYYDQLDDNAKIIYSSLENNINHLKENNYTIDFSTKFNTLLHESTGQYKLNKSFQSALDALFYDHPELFYLDLTKISLIIKYTTIGPKTTYTVSISPKDNNNYLYGNFKSQTQVKEAISKVENIRNNFIAKISNNISDYDKALKVHDALVNSLEYDSSATRINTRNIYGALVEKTVVCEGYAKAFKYILDSLNIECILVSGDATNSSGESESHMWNYIKLDGNWYGVDVTWDDPIVVGGLSKNIIRHNYFCKGYYTFTESHSPSIKISDEGQTFSLPELSKENYK